MSAKLLSEEELVEQEASDAAAYYRRSHKAKADPQLWQWICGALFTLLVGLSGYALASHSCITPADAERLVTGPTNPYVQDKQSLEQRLATVEKIDVKLDSLQRQLTRICIAVGVDPDGTTEVARPRHKGE